RGRARRPARRAGRGAGRESGGRGGRGPLGRPAPPCGGPPPPLPRDAPPPPPGFPAPPPGAPGPPLLAIGYWVGLFWTVAALTSLLAGSLQPALHQSRAQAEALSEVSAELQERGAPPPS